MNLAFRKTLSIIIVCLTALGILFSLFLVIQVWRYREPVTITFQSSVEQVSSVLQITDDGLLVIDQVVKNVYTSTADLDNATTAFSQTILSTGQFIDLAGTFIGEDLISTITNTQTALASAQASAKVIDNILSTLAKVPLIGVTYNPSVPLNTALGDVSSSLDPLQDRLKDFQANLESTNTNMQAFSGQVTELKKDVLLIQANLVQATTTIDKYHGELSRVQSSLVQVKTNLQRWTGILAWVLTLVITWLVIIQISLMLQGFTQLTNKDLESTATNQSL